MMNLLSMTAFYQPFESPFESFLLPLESLSCVPASLQRLAMAAAGGASPAPTEGRRPRVIAAAHSKKRVPVIANKFEKNKQMNDAR